MEGTGSTAYLSRRSADGEQMDARLDSMSVCHANAPLACTIHTRQYSPDASTVVGTGVPNKSVPPLPATPEAFHKAVLMRVDYIRSLLSPVCTQLPYFIISLTFSTSDL